MFVYEFKSTNYLITKIVISGLNLTVYTNKQNAEELEGIIKTLDFNSYVSADHPEHVFCHNNYIDLSATDGALSLKHVKLNNISSMKEIPTQMSELLNFLIEMQQDAFNNYGITSPYISPNEYSNFLASLNTYYSQSYNIQQNTLVLYAEYFLKTHWDIIYEGKIDNEQERDVIDYQYMSDCPN